MTNRNTPTDFHDLHILERLELIEQIWDSIVDDADSVMLSETQKRQLQEWLDAFYVNPEPGQPVSETLEVLRERGAAGREGQSQVPE